MKQKYFEKNYKAELSMQIVDKDLSYILKVVLRFTIM